MYENSACNPPPSSCPCAVFHCNVIIYNYLLYGNAFISRHFCRHFKVHHIAGVVLNNQQHAFSAVACFDRFIHLVRRRRGKHSPCNRCVQHAFPNIAAVGWFMAAPAAAYQRHFPLGAACPYHYVASVYPLYVFRMGCYHSLQHFFHNVVWFVNHFFQSNFLLLHYTFYYYKAESVCHSGI